MPSGRAPLRAGHGARITPEQYLKSWELRANMFTDPVLRPLYADVVLATQAPLLARGRAAAVGRLLWRDIRRAWRGQALVRPDQIQQPYIAPTAEAAPGPISR